MTLIQASLSYCTSVLQVYSTCIPELIALHSLPKGFIRCCQLYGLSRSLTDKIIYQASHWVSAANVKVVYHHYHRHSPIIPSQWFISQQSPIHFFLCSHKHLLPSMCAVSKFPFMHLPSIFFLHLLHCLHKSFLFIILFFMLSEESSIVSLICQSLRKDIQTDPDTLVYLHLCLSTTSLSSRHTTLSIVNLCLSFTLRPLNHQRTSARTLGVSEIQA